MICAVKEQCEYEFNKTIIQIYLDKKRKTSYRHKKRNYSQNIS